MQQRTRSDYSRGALGTSRHEGGAYSLLKGCHPRHEKQRAELDRALHIEVCMRKRFDKLPECSLVECIVLVFFYLSAISGHCNLSIGLKLPLERLDLLTCSLFIHRANLQAASPVQL